MTLSVRRFSITIAILLEILHELFKYDINEDRRASISHLCCSVVDHQRSLFPNGSMEQREWLFQLVKLVKSEGVMRMLYNKTTEKLSLRLFTIYASKQRQLGLQ